MDVNFIVVPGGDGRITVKPAPLAAVSAELKPWISRVGDPDPAGGLLE